MGTNRLSHSAATKFQQCPRAYKFHYIDRLRPKIQSAALLFGSAVDAACGALLKNEGKDPVRIFTYMWNFSDINSERTYLPTCTRIAYSKSDFDIELISAKHREKLAELYTSDWEADLNLILEKQKKKVAFKFWSLEEKTLYNHACHCVLHAKGLLMIEAVKTKVLPQITEVLATQKYVKLKNDGGDEVIGFADLICRYKGFDKPVIFDVKTSSIEYEEDSVLTSSQLSLYVHALSSEFENTRTAGYIVLSKHVQKNRKKTCESCGFDGTGTRFKTCNNDIGGVRCDGKWQEKLDPEVRVQIITDDIPVQTEDLVLENIDDINIAIKSGTFIRNLGSCVMGWGKCSYYDLCYHGKEDDLVKLESKK
jgi:hypothetical protein